MTFMAIIISKAIPDEHKAELATAVPKSIGIFRSAPGVKAVYAGPVVATKAGRSTDLKICQVIEFESKDSFASLKGSSIFDELKASSKHLPEPESVDLYEIESFPTPAELKAVFQISRMVMTDPAQQETAGKEFRSLMEGAASKKKTWGGKNLITEGAGVFCTAWDSSEEIMEASASPDAKKGAAIMEKYGTNDTIFVKLQGA